MDSINVRQQLLNAFGEDVRKDNEINGGDAVEFVCDLVQGIIADEKKRKRRKAKTANSFSLVDLNTAELLARAVLDEDPAARKMAGELLKSLKDMKGQQRAHRLTIKTARDQYANDDVQIDDNPILSCADEGTWVNAWVWVPHRH